MRSNHGKFAVHSNHGNQQSPQDRRRNSATLSPTLPCCPRALSSPTFASDVLRRLARARPCAPLLPWSLVREDDRWPSPGVTRSEPHSGTGNVSPPAGRSGASGGMHTRRSRRTRHWSGLDNSPLLMRLVGPARWRPRSVSHGARFHSSAAATRCGMHARAPVRSGFARKAVAATRCGAAQCGRSSQVRARPVAAGPGVVAHRRLPGVALAWPLTLRLRDGRTGRFQSGRPAVVPSGKQLTRVGASSWTRAALTVH